MDEILPEDKQGPWQPATGVVREILISTRLSEVCQECAARSACWHARGCLGALHCSHSELGTTLIINGAGKTIGSWRQYPVPLREFVDWLAIRGREAQETMDRARVDGRGISFFDVDGLDQPPS